MQSWISIVLNLDKDENISLCKRQAFIYSAAATLIDILTTKSYTSRMKSDSNICVLCVHSLSNTNMHLKVL